MTNPEQRADLSAPAALAGALYIGPDNALRVSSLNSATGVRLTVAGKILTADGAVRSFVFEHVPNTDRTLATTSHQPGCGWILNAHVVASSGTPRRGQCFVRLQVIQGFTGATISIGTVLQGYVQDTSARAWPGSPIEASTRGPGVIRSVTGTDPAAGAEISETVPTNARWRLLAIRFTLVTDANVANRRPNLSLDDGTTEVARSLITADATAGATFHYSYQMGVQSQAGSGNYFNAHLCAQHALPGGFRIRTATTNLQVGDNFGAPQLLVEEWIED